MSQENPSADKPKLPKNHSLSINGIFLRLTVRLSQTEKLLLTKYLSVLLVSGLAIDDAIDVLLQGAKGSLKKILQTLQTSVRSGNTLASGLKQYPHIFSGVFTSLIAAGESSGLLQKNIERLSDQLQKEHDLRSKIIGALIYPSVVMMSAVTVSVIIVVFVLPNITSLFSSMDVPLPITTRALLFVANIFTNHGPLVAISAITFVVLAIIIRSMAFFHPITHWLVLHTPILGKIVKDTNLSRITRLLGTLLQSGMPISNALPITISIVKNYYYKRLFSRLLLTIGQGRTISVGLAHSEFLIPVIAFRLIKVGEETGTLGDMLVYLADFYAQEVDDATKNATTLFEPLMIIMIGLMVGVLAFSIITPIYAVIETI